ncbi:uncharacterized protein LOC107745106 isoform X2 [Sinocyclocheilus rhinocerous]|uniref:uncharacterized protein LOC107745106 isoform X2 n=1 Tax=Sinocyclocheilus rhinocerous TaxID=307959 RepID=UPI0007BAD62F|nr:PREDICTED: uncharacterized protein LOC107745106 isoform X2 [Sinocyclocheilus rhinocerous]
MRSFTPPRLQFHISLSLFTVLWLSVRVPRAPLSLQGGDPLETSLKSVRGEKAERKNQASFFCREGLLTRVRQRLHHKPANTLTFSSTFVRFFMHPIAGFQQGLRLLLIREVPILKFSLSISVSGRIHRDPKPTPAQRRAPRSAKNLRDLPFGSTDLRLTHSRSVRTGDSGVKLRRFGTGASCKRRVKISVICMICMRKHWGKKKEACGKRCLRALTSSQMCAQEKFEMD